MKVTSFENTIAPFIVGGGITWLKVKLWWDFDINLSDVHIYKAYYELKEFLTRNSIVNFDNKDQFIDVVVEVLKILEREVDEELLEDPEFVKDALKSRAWLWNIYSFFRDFVTSDTIKSVVDSPITKAIDRYLNSVLIANPVLLDYKVHRDVDFAISDYGDLTGDTGEVTIAPPTFTEEQTGETLLGGEIRLTDPFKKDYEM